MLDGHVPGPEKPARRTRFTRRIDLAVAVLIAVAAVVAGVLVWWNGDVRATSSQTYDGPVPTPQLPTVFPPSLGESWRAPSSATPVPVAVGATVVTADGGEVVGRDPLTGDMRWRYARDLPLCTVSSAWSMVLTAYATDGNLLPDRDSRAQGGCSEITALDPASGRRGRQPKPTETGDKPESRQRNADAELGTRLIADGTYVTTTGTRLLTTWRSDLVQTMQFGTVPAVVNPDKQPRTDCTYGTVTASSGRIAVIERCPGDPGDRLTVYRATGEKDDAEKPQVVSSVVTGGRGARVVAMTEKQVAVALPDPARLVVFDEQGQEVASHPLELPEKDLAGEVEGHVVPTTKGTGAVYWFTGSRTIALSTRDLRPLWIVQNTLGTLGPGTVFAGRLLVPVPDGLAVINQATGELVGTIPVDRETYSGPVTMSTLGPMVLEQRGNLLVALH